MDRRENDEAAKESPAAVMKRYSSLLAKVRIASDRVED